MHFHGIAVSLGMYPSDLLFSNKMIWVEGPTDAIYIDFWLRKYIEEKGFEKLKKGLDYEFSLFGGASSENFYLLEDDYEWDPKKEKQDEGKIFDLLKTHPQSFVVMDNDGGELKKPNGKIGNSKFENFKKSVISSENIPSWYDEKKKFHTIEMYRKDVKKIFKEDGKDKIKFEKKKLQNFSKKREKAMKYCRDNQEKKFSEITKKECEEMIEKIYNFINS